MTRSKSIKTISIVLVIIGFGCFFAPLIVNFNPGTLPHSFEWPMGYSSNVIETKSGLRIVPHQPTGRIQLYDADWKFICGWSLPDKNQVFLLMPFLEETQQLTVMSYNGGKGSDENKTAQTYLFDLDGNLLSRQSAPYSQASFYALPRTGESLWVPTHFWLIPLSSPFIAGGVIAIGLLGLELLRRKGKPSDAAV